MKPLVFADRVEQCDDRAIVRTCRGKYMVLMETIVEQLVSDCAK